MKVFYKYCEKCKKIKPYLTYFLSKKENERLSKEDRLLCYDCYILKGVKEMSIKLYKTIEDWWKSLDYDLKIELMENEYPDEANLIEVEEMWNGLNWEEKYEIYSKSDNEIDLTDEEKTDIKGDKEAHRIMVEGREIE